MGKKVVSNEMMREMRNLGRIHRIWYSQFWTILLILIAHFNYWLPYQQLIDSSVLKEIEAGFLSDDSIQKLLDGKFDRKYFSPTSRWAQIFWTFSNIFSIADMDWQCGDDAKVSLRKVGSIFKYNRIPHFLRP